MKVRVILLGLVFASLATPALAYLDPGSGSMFLQVVVGAIAAGAMTIRMTWQRIKNACRSLFGSRSKPLSDSDNES